MTTPTYLRTATAGLCGLALFTQTAGAAPVAQSFEIRYFTENPAANGETDFKGKTEFLNTEQRVDFLRAYADYGRAFWNDPRLDREVFPLADARALTGNIKRQPRPQVRVRLLEDDWAWHGLPSAQTAYKEAARKLWVNSPALRLADGRLSFVQGATTGFPIVPALNWRGRLQFDLDLSQTQEESTIALDQGVVVGFDAQRRFFYLTEQKRVYPDVALDSGSISLAVEVDFTTRRFNARIDDRLLADYVPF